MGRGVWLRGEPPAYWVFTEKALQDGTKDMYSGYTATGRVKSTESSQMMTHTHTGPREERWRGHRHRGSEG
jgi:hypothetical protein